VGTYCTAINALEPAWDSKINAINEHPGGLFDVFVVFMMFSIELHVVTCTMKF